jgi:hypothetical protein
MQIIASFPPLILFAFLLASCLPMQNPAPTPVDTFDYYGSQENYNGIPTIQAKTRLAMKKTGGIMFWALDHDAQGEFSLVSAIYQIVHK